MKTYLKTMEKLPHMAKKIDFQEVQEAQRVPKKLVSSTHQGTSSLHYPRLKIKTES